MSKIPEVKWKGPFRFLPRIPTLFISLPLFTYVVNLEKDKMARVILGWPGLIGKYCSFPSLSLTGPLRMARVARPILLAHSNPAKVFGPSVLKCR